MFAEAVLSVFSQRYADARDQFVSHAETSSIVEKFSHLPHTLKGPKNEKLFCDIAWAGNPKADKVLVVVSGVHGVEGGAGSAIQSDFLSRYRRLPADVGVVLVHALNPWGFAWASRNDDEGIDVNRNFVDFNAKLPVSPVPPRSGINWSRAKPILPALPGIVSSLTCCLKGNTKSRRCLITAARTGELVTPGD